MNILNEAFKKMENLDEDVFTLDKKGIEEMDAFLKNDDDPFAKLNVIDAEAPNEDELQDSYDGKVIITCPVCHSDIFADPASLEINEDEVTTHTECPYCHTTDEFKIKGQVVPFNTDDVEVEDDAEDEIDVKNESLTEAREAAADEDTGCVENIKKALTDRLFGTSGHTMSAPGVFMEDIREYNDNSKEEDIHDCSEKDFILAAKQLGLKIYEVQYGYNGDHDYLFLKPGKSIKDYNKFYDLDSDEGDVGNKKLIYRGSVNSKNESLNESSIAPTGNQDAPKIPVVDDLLDPSKYVIESDDNKKGITLGWALEKKKDKLNKISTKEELIDLVNEVADECSDKAYVAKTINELKRLPFIKGYQFLYDMILKNNGLGSVNKKTRKFDYDVKHNESLKEDKQAAKVVDKYQKWVDYDMKKYGKISDVTKKKLAKAGFEVVKDDHGDYEVIAKDLKESIDIHVDRENEDVSVKTDGIVVDATDKEVHVHDDKEEEPVEVVEPITKETEDKILKANDMADEDDYVEEEPAEEEEEEVEFSEFEESYFNKLGTSYLRENYGNVRNFETTSAKESNGKFIVEGIINFRSGTTKKTSFVFEGKTISKTGRMKLLGENKEIGTGRNAFVLRAKYDNGKVMCESLTYNYTTKDGNKKINVYGKAKISK